MKVVISKNLKKPAKGMSPIRTGIIGIMQQKSPR